MPTNDQAWSALAVRECGARLAHGPWQSLGRGRYAVPAVAYLSMWPLPDVVLGLERGRWVAVERTAGGVAAPETMRW